MLAGICRACRRSELKACSTGCGMSGVPRLSPVLSRPSGPSTFSCRSVARSIPVIFSIAGASNT
jgi:hypothetical protein